MSEKKLNQFRLEQKAYLSDSERKLELEERGKIFEWEYQNFGTLRDCRFVDICELPQISTIVFSFQAGKIVFEKLPENVDIVYILMDETHIEVYTESPLNRACVYRGYAIFPIACVEKNVEYDLKIYKAPEEKMHLVLGQGKLSFYNSITDEAHYYRITGSFVDIILSGNGYLRFDMMNLLTHKLTFRKSENLEQALSLWVDECNQYEGDTTFEPVRSGLVVYDPVLEAALQRQSLIEEVNAEEGMHYSYVRYGLVKDSAGHSNLFEDVFRYKNFNNRTFNIDFLLYKL